MTGEQFKNEMDKSKGMRLRLKGLMTNINIIHPADICIFTKKIYWNDYVSLTWKPKYREGAYNLTGQFVGSDEMGREYALSLN